ncbi:MAG: hypothetical protein KatS3mg051_1247 [Anaerolineae bacterium]|nr:MAG: hypothetical protein KatS3mg051_1247 [Anaerolineae bacterium]
MEYITLTVGLILYTAAFIADIVRAGIQAVPYGQIEAARAQGFTNSQMLRLIVLPQAHAPDHPAAGQPVPEPGQELQPGRCHRVLRRVQRRQHHFQPDGAVGGRSFAIMMAIYLATSLTISLVMNAVNYSLRLRSR